MKLAQFHNVHPFKNGIRENGKMAKRAVGGGALRHKSHKCGEIEVDIISSGDQICRRRFLPILVRCELDHPKVLGG